MVLLRAFPGRTLWCPQTASSVYFEISLMKIWADSARCQAGEKRSRLTSAPKAGEGNRLSLVKAGPRAA